ncbi:MAG: 3-methyl-2-oxobutanoate dehydrogenase subunit VorB [Clostridia bacterium]
MAKKLTKGNEAIAEAAIRGGCRFFFGYPITPQNEIPEYMSKRLPEVGGCFIQSESEVAAINMVYGAACAGARAMTSSSSPGISLKQEGISYIATAELPCVVLNMVRGGPGLGTIYPAQGDYFQAVKGGGHGDYKMLVYTPANIQEAVDIMYEAFDKADQYRVITYILGDATIGQMMEPVEMPEFKDVTTFPAKPWALTGHTAKEHKIMTTLEMNPDKFEGMIDHMYDVYDELKRNEVRYEAFMCEDADTVVVAYGTASRIAKTAVKLMREQGLKVGLFRPITVFPFPEKQIAELAKSAHVKRFFVTELSKGQMVEDVRLSVNGLKPVEFYGRNGGNVMTAEELINVISKGE